MATAILQYRVDGGALHTDSIEVSGGAEITLTAASFAGWKTAARWEIVAYPPDWTAPAGWTLSASSGYYYYLANSGASGITPPAITIPDPADFWGKWEFRLTVNGTIVSERLGVETLSPTLGLHDLAVGEGREFGGNRKWVGPEQENKRILDDAALAAVGTPDQKYLIQAGTVDAGTPQALPLEALTTSIDIRSTVVPLKVQRSGVAASDVEALRVRRSVTDNSGNATSSTAEHIAFEIPNGAGSPTDVANIKVQISSTIGPSANIVLSPMGSGTIAPALTAKGGGIIQFNSSDYAHDGYRLILDGSGNLSASVLTFDEVNAALALADAAIDFNGQQLTGVADAVADTDAPNWGQVQALAQGLDIKASVLVATTANITLSGTQTIDGVAVTAGKRVLVKDQSTASQNGYYLCAAGAWTRTTDLAAGAGAAGVFCFVEQGTDNHDTGWVCTSNDGSDVVGTDSLAFTQFSSTAVTAGDGLTKTGNTIDVVAADGSITVNANSIEASGSFGAKNISQTGATSITAGSGGFIGVQINRASSGTFTFGSNITTLAGTALAMTGIASLDNNGGAIDIGANSTVQNVGKSGTTWAIRGAATVASTLGVGDATTVTKSGNAATTVAGLTLQNTTATSGGTTEQRAPVLLLKGQGRDTSGAGSNQEVDVILVPTLTAASGGPTVELRPQYQRAGGGFSNFGGYWTTSATGLGGLAFTVGTIVIDTTGNGVRFATDGNGGLKKDSTDVMLTSGGSNALVLATNSTRRHVISSTGAITKSKDTSAVERTQHGTAGVNYKDATGLGVTVTGAAGATTLYTIATVSGSFPTVEVEATAFEVATPANCRVFAKRRPFKNIAGTITDGTAIDIHADDDLGTVWGSPPVLAIVHSGTDILIQGTPSANDTRFVLKEVRVFACTTGA